jgi:hypothetical protein
MTVEEIRYKLKESGISADNVKKLVADDELLIGAINAAVEATKDVKITFPDLVYAVHITIAFADSIVDQCGERVKVTPKPWQAAELVGQMSAMRYLVGIARPLGLSESAIKIGDAIAAYMRTKHPEAHQ